MRINYDDIEIGKEYYVVLDEDIEKVMVYSTNDLKTVFVFNVLAKYTYSGKIVYNNIQHLSITFYRNVHTSYIFTTKKEAVEFIKKRDRIIIDKYKSKIKTVKDLLELPFRVLINDDDDYYINFNAREAYKERCYELLGVKISTNNLKELTVLNDEDNRE